MTPGAAHGPSAGISARAMAVAPFHVMRLLARARELESRGASICHLEIGEPDFPTPPPVVEAARRAIDAGEGHYTPAAGLPALREDIAAYYRRRYGLTLDPGRVIVTPGASGALQLAMLAALDPGQTLVIADPSYPCYRQIGALVGARIAAIPIGAGDGFRLTRARLAQAAPADIRALLVASPANPTGSVLSVADLAGLHQLCQERGAALIADEIYQGLTYDAADHTAAALGDEGVYVVNSFSKYFGMTGWRVGWVIAPRAAAPALERLAQNLFIAAPTLSQHAARAALAAATAPLLEGRRAVLEQRRDVLWAGLRALGFGVAAPPRGAFYIYARLPEGLEMDATELASRLLEEHGVAVTPGIDFGLVDAERHLRFAFTRPIEEIETALERLGACPQLVGG